MTHEEFKEKLDALHRQMLEIAGRDVMESLSDTLTAAEMLVADHTAEKVKSRFESELARIIEEEKQ